MPPVGDEARGGRGVRLLDEAGDGVRALGAGQRRRRVSI